ncbi:WYL domain-containing protein, partial [Vibrio parahaemolyticus]|nr:WYL domain-containing protein [Vibrio parahaemolyticus]
LAEVGIERDIRTLQRIMETLSEQFNLDRNDKSKPYGYKLTQVNAVLSLPTLSAQESLLFHLAREYLAGLLPSRMFAAMDGF